jgi:hypothetical protein
MPSVFHPANLLLQALPAAELAALRPHLRFVELVKNAVLVEAGEPLTRAYLPESGAVSMRVRLSEDKRWRSSATTACWTPRSGSTARYR